MTDQDTGTGGFHRVPLMERGDRIEVRLAHQGTIWLSVTTDGTALRITAGRGFLLEDPLGNRMWTTDLIVQPAGEDT